MWVERLTPKASPEELVEFNKRLISKFISSDKGILQRAEEIFGRLFQEFQHINHNDQFHGTESLLYHQYMAMHSFNTFMDMVCDELSASDPFVRHLESLLKSLEERTSIGKKELKELLNENPPSCSKDLKTLLFLAALFHDIGKLYNTERWEKEFADETLKLRKFQRHASYGSLLFRILALRQSNYMRIFSSITSITQQEIAKLEAELPAAQGN
ncbi:HD domain-containing protein, partial [Candidatus Woesearchaeota archaeon]|nr:HD domain-containing protein [Candidatus Woesearchaeota archaeon]